MHTRTELGHEYAVEDGGSLYRYRTGRPWSTRRGCAPPPGEGSRRRRRATALRPRGQKGSDCIPGGGGADTLRGSQDTDVCIGGPGIDLFHATCETQIQ